MDFPRALVVLFLFTALYLVAQVFLFIRIRVWLQSHLQDRKRQRLLTGAAAFFFLAMLFPLAWRQIYGWHVDQVFPHIFRGILTLSAIWSFGSMGLVISLLAYDSLRRLLPLLHRRSAKPPDLDRRDFLKKGLGVAAVAPFVISGYGVLLARHRFEIEYFDLPFHDFSSALSQLSIVHLTDIHVGPFMPAEELAAYVEAVNRLKPDFVALTGDFVSTSLNEIAPCVDTLAELKARYGIFACIGNHDVYARADGELTRSFRQKGIHVLRNDAVSIPIGNTAVNILGIDDLRWGRPNLARALDVSHGKPGEVQILLSHRPEVFPQAARTGIDLVLSGHYHGGQIKLGPGPDSLSIARFVTPYAEGLFQLSRRRLERSREDANNAVLFVGRGVGITGLPIRINCPPQIAHLTLRKA